MGPCETWFSLLNHLCWGFQAIWCHAEAALPLTSQPRVNWQTLFKMHTHAHTLKCKRSTYLTVLLSELVHLQQRERQTETERPDSDRHTHRQSCQQADAAVETMTPRAHSHVHARQRIAITIDIQIHARAHSNKCREWPGWWTLVLSPRSLCSPTSCPWGRRCWKWRCSLGNVFWKKL